MSRAWQAGTSERGKKQQGKGKGSGDAEYKAKRAMEFARSPAKNLLMYAFMLWMSGNSIQIFSIVMTSTVVWQPLKALASMEQAFSRFEEPGVNLLMPKLVYVACNSLGLAVGLYKLHALGLLPTHVSDWLSSLPPSPYKELSGGGLPLLT